VAACAVALGGLGSGVLSGALLVTAAVVGAVAALGPRHRAFLLVLLSAAVAVAGIVTASG
jgi:hypothetical protein